MQAPANIEATNTSITTLPIASAMVKMVNTMISLPHDGGTGASKGYEGSPTLAFTKPNDSEKVYYFFANANGTLHSHVLSMATLSSFGTYENPNLLPDQQGNYIVTAIKHENRQDYWIVMKHYFTNEFKAYLVTNEGVSNAPIVSKIGKSTTPYANPKVIFNSSAIGGRLAFKLDAVDRYEVYQMDLQTGIIHDVKSFSNLHGNALTFSNDGSKLYLAKAYSESEDQILELAFNAGGVSEMLEHSHVFATVPHKPIARMKFSEVGKLYISTTDIHYFGVVENGTFTQNGHPKTVITKECTCNETGNTTSVIVNNHFSGYDTFFLSDYRWYDETFFDSPITSLPKGSPVKYTFSHPYYNELNFSFSEETSGFNYGWTLFPGEQITQPWIIKSFNNPRPNPEINSLGWRNDFVVDIETWDGQTLTIPGISNEPLFTVTPASCRLLEDELGFVLTDEEGTALDLETCEYELPAETYHLLHEFNYRILTENGENIEFETANY
jgi:hypothetical protein